MQNCVRHSTHLVFGEDSSFSGAEEIWRYKTENLEFICMLKYFQDSKIILCDETLLDRDGIYITLSTFKNFQYTNDGLESRMEFSGSSSPRIYITIRILIIKPIK